MYNDSSENTYFKHTDENVYVFKGQLRFHHREEIDEYTRRLRLCTGLHFYNGSSHPILFNALPLKTSFVMSTLFETPIGIAGNIK